MKFFLFFVAVLVCLSFNAWGQRQKFIGIEFGADVWGCSSPEKKYIRGKVDDFASYEIADNLQGQFFKSFVGAKIEIQSQNEKWGLSGGLRYMHATSILDIGGWFEYPSYFYFLFRQNGTTTEYLRVEAITQTSDFIGLPIELRIFPFNAKRVKPYFKVGAEFNVLVNSSTNFDFENNAMEVFEKEASKITGDPRSLYASLYFSGGVKFGKFVNLDIVFPSFMLSQGSSSLVRPMGGAGIQFTFQLPLSL